MLKIRQEQFDVLQRAASKDREDRLIDHLRRCAPVVMRGRTLHGLRLRIREVIDVAPREHLEDERALIRYVEDALREQTA